MSIMKSVLFNLLGKLDKFARTIRSSSTQMLHRVLGKFLWMLMKIILIYCPSVATSCMDLRVLVLYMFAESLELDLLVK